MTTIEKSRAYQYAKWCAADNNAKIGRYVRKQAKLWCAIVEGKDPEAYVSEKAYKKIRKILKLMIHPDLLVPMYEGLEDYGMFFVVAVLCTKARRDDSRYYHTGLLEICRKNFKTFNSAVIFIILMLTDPRFSRFFSVAPDFKLSSELRLAVRKIIKASPALEKHFRVRRDFVSCDVTDSEYTPLAYSNDRMDGKLANAFLADEAGAMDSYPVEAMRSSQITLLNKLGIIISTQYPNENNVMIDEIDRAKKILDGLLANKRYFALLYEPDDEIIKEWEKNDRVIYQSNPVAVSLPSVFDSLLEMREMAILYENKRENYLCKHNNIMYKGLGTEGFVDIEKVRACKIKDDPMWWQGRTVYLGLDLSQTDDNTAVAMLTESDGNVYAKVWGFIPAEKIEQKSNKEHFDYKVAIAAGDCFPCGDEVIDYGFVEAFILAIPEKYGVEIAQIGYDRYNALSTAQKLEYEGFEMVEVRQHSSVLHAPTKLLLELILSRHFCYAENKLLENNFSNARCTEDTNRNKYVNKKKSAGKVDEVVALIIAMCLYQLEQLNQADCTIQVI